MTKKRILLKIGTNTLTKETNHISRGKIEDIGMQIAATTNMSLSLSVLVLSQQRNSL
jgi:glutamate 5-kinase